MRALFVLLGPLLGSTLPAASAVPFRGFTREVAVNTAATANLTTAAGHFAAATPSDLFRFSQSTPGVGLQPGHEICTDGQKGTVQTWLTDIGSMLSTILPALDKLESGEANTDLLRNLYTWFGIRKKPDNSIADEDKDDFNDVREMYDLVQSFLNQQMQSLVGDHKPWLYCDSTWLQEMTVVYDRDRHPMTYVDSNGITQVVGPRTAPPDVVSSQTLREDLRDWQHKEQNGDWSFFPYYAPDLNEVVTEPHGHQYRGEPPSFCNGVANDQEQEYQEGRYVGLDEDAIPTITVCPRVFTTGLVALQNALDSPQVKVRGTPFGDVIPQSLVLFHELMHAVDPGSTPDNCYGVSDCLQARRDHEVLVKTPDSLVFCAYAFYLSQQGPEPKSSWARGVAAG